MLQVLTGDKVELIKSQLLRDVEGPYTKYLSEMEAELDSFKG